MLVFKIDRLTRSTKDLITLMELFNDKGCAFNSLTESIDTHTASGRMFIKIIGIFAEFERENIIERVTVALDKKAREGYIHSGYGLVPYGYNREIGNREITIDEEESRIVKEIFAMYLNQHKSFNAIATELNLRNVQSSKNRGWSCIAVKYILGNPLYIGKVRHALFDTSRYFEVDGKHEGIIPEKTFLEVQSKMAKMQKIIKKRPREENYFCGTLRCAVCGSKMTTHGQYRNLNEQEVYYGSYMCLGRNNKSCSTGTFGHNKVELAFREYIESYADFTVQPDLDAQADELKTDTGVAKAEYEKSLSKLLQKEKDVMRLYIGEKIDFEEYGTMLEIIRNEKKAYALKITELENIEQKDTEFKKEDIIMNFKENWDELTNLERMQFLQTYIEAIYVLRETDTREIKIKRLEFHKN